MPELAKTHSSSVFQQNAGLSRIDEFLLSMIDFEDRKFMSMPAPFNSCECETMIAQTIRASASNLREEGRAYSKENIRPDAPMQGIENAGAFKTLVSKGLFIYDEEKREIEPSYKLMLMLMTKFSEEIGLTGSINNPALTPASASPQLAKK